MKESSNNIIIHNHNIEANNNILVCNDHVVYAKTPGVTSLKVSYNYNGTIFEITKDINIIDIVHNAERLFVEGSKGILVGTSETLKVSSYPKVSDLKVKYQSSDETIATVDANGKITALKEGNCLITISLLDDSTVYTTHKVTLIKQKELSEVGGSTSSGEYLGRYYEESIKYYYELMHDVKETTYIGYTSTKTSGIDVDGYTGLSGMIEPDKFYPQMVHVLEVPSSKSLKVVPWANLIGNKWTLTTVKGFINNYEESHPGSKVICAINGDFFDISANGNLPYQTTGENVSDGEFYRTSNGHGGGGTLGFTNNGTADSLIADGKAERTKNMILAVYDENNNIINEFEVENLNKEPIEGQSSVYFGNYNSNKEYEPISFDVISGSNVYMIDEAELALPNNPSDFYGLGTISSLEAKTINKGQFAIVSRNKLINETLKVGVRIRIQYEFTGRFKDVTGATGYNNLIYNDVNQLHDGYIADRAPRTVLGKKADGTLVMMVIDGRQGGDGMYGADGTELAAIMKSYGCVNAYNLDGGGSSTIVVREETGLKVLNSPSDNRERTDGNCILIVAEDPNYTVTTSEITSSSATITINTDNPSYITDIPCLEINGKIYDSVNNKVTLDNLVHNTKYDYKVYYKDSKGNYYETLTVGSFTTAKANFKYLGVTLEETDDSYTFKSYCNDVDSAGNVMSMEIEFNGLITYFSNGKIVLSKSIFGDYIENVKFRYNYEDNGKIVFVDTNEYAVLN